MSQPESMPANAADLPEASAPAADTKPAGPSEPSLETRLAELQAKHDELSDAFLRAKAEMENVRRRADDEVSKARKFAIESFADSMLLSLIHI